MKPHRATLILILGIAGIVFCGPFTGIPAWIMGNNDLKEMANGIMDPSGRSTTQIGKIIGIISTIVGILFLVAIVIGLVMFFVLAPSINRQ